MIIPSIDLMGGNAVQLIGGKEKAIDAGDPRPIAEKFRIAGEIAVIDLDAALSQGSNADTIEALLKMAPCRVGGGIRDVDTAIRWLDAGATKIILGTAAQPEILKQLPPDRVIAALDAYNDDVVIKGWTEKTGRTVIDRMKELEGLVGHFMVTFVEREGRLQGIDLNRVAQLKEAAGNASLTVAGGVTTLDDVDAIDKLGVDAQVGMALYSNKMHLADAISCTLESDRPDGYYPTVVTDEHGVALGLCYSSDESLRKAIDMQRGVYQSRSRGLWVKGETSGATQKLLRIDRDCDRDALRFTVVQETPGFCHENTWTCWGERKGLPALKEVIDNRMKNAPEGSYTKRLFTEDGLLPAKLIEEAGELARARTHDEITWESADVIYFTLTAMAKAGVSIADVESELERRSRKVTRRKGDAKPPIQ